MTCNTNYELQLIGERFEINRLCMNVDSTNVAVFVSREQYYEHEVLLNTFGARQELYDSAVT